METKHEADNESLRGNGLPMRYLRLLAPPLQLLSATMWQVVQQGLVDHYGMLEEFVTMVTELVPELMSYSQRAQLILGLRARLVLEMCRKEEPVDLKDIEFHLNRIKAPVSTAKDHHETINRVEKSEVNFVELVHSLLEDLSKRSSFFEEVFPEYYGPKYDTALEMLVWEFITRLEELLPAPDFTQLAALLGDAPCLLEDCLQSFFAPDDMKAVVEHHRNLGFFEEKESRLLPMDDCILSALSVPSETKPVPDSALLELKGHSKAGERRTSSRQLHNRNDGKTNNHLSANTVDLTSSTETEDGLSTENGHSQNSGGRVLRKRKRPGVVDIPSKQPTKASLHLNSSVDDDSGDSPLISIWGDYTDSPNTSTGSETNEKKWSDEETLILLDIWGMNAVNLAQKGCLKNRQMCAQISQRLAELGFRRTAEQCQSRIKRLKRYFSQINKGNTKVDCKFYDKLERILTTDATCGAEEVDDEDDLNEMEDLQFITQNIPLDISPETVSSPGRTAWTDCETLVLINTWGENKAHLGLKGGQTTAQMFSAISKNMALLGFFRTPEQCQARIKRLRAMFKQCNENNTISGVEECKFYNELARVLVNDHSIDEEVDKALEELKDDDLSSYFNQDLDAVFNIQEERKKVQWSDKETVLLLELWGDSQVQQNLKRFPHNTPVYNDIAEKLAARGYRRSADQCYTRIKRLKATYRHCLDKSIKGSDKSDFKFYHILEKILDNQPSTSSTRVMDSIEISEDSMSNSVPETDGDFTDNTAVVWSDEEVRTLIDIWAEEEHKNSMRGDLYNGEIFTNISEKMVSLGYSKSLEQCSLKVMELKNNFQQCYDRKKAGQKIEYRFYNQLEPILGQEFLMDDPDEERDPVVADGASTVWTHGEIMAFLEIWAAHDTQQILKSSFRNGPVYADISGKMATLGYQRTAEQCHDQITRLKKNYRRYCRGGTRRSVFPYYHIMAPVLGGVVNADGTDSNPEGFMDKDLDACEQPSTSQQTSDQGRKSTWSDRETRLLLKIWGEDRIQLAIKGSTKNRHVYDYISNALSTNGFTRNAEQCYTRIKRLKAGYHHEKKRFRYYKEMEEILKKVPKADTSFEDGSFPELSFTDMSLSDISLLDDPDPNKGIWTGDGTKVIWSDRETKVLLDIWASGDIQENLKGTAKNKHLFDQISKAMLTQGYMRSADQCRSRIKRLRANFRSFLDGRKGSKHECKFFDLLMRAFGSKSMNSGPSAEDGYNSVQDLGPAEGGAEGGAEYGGFYISSPYSHKGDGNIQ